MSIHQIRELYDFANIEFSLDSNRLNELKKILLLHLKSTAEGTFSVQGQVFTKNEILQLFAKTYSDNSFDIEKIVNKHGSIAPLLNPKMIPYKFTGDKVELMSNPHWSEIQEYFSQNHFITFSKLFRSDIKSKNFDTAADSVSYLFLFDDEIQLKFKRIAKNEIQVLLNATALAKNFLFVTKGHYYDVLKEVANDDLDFLIFQYNILIRRVDHFNFKRRSQFYGFQLGLNFDAYVKSQIKNDKATFTVELSHEQSSFKKVVTYLKLAVIPSILVIFIYFSRQDSRPEIVAGKGSTVKIRKNDQSVYPEDKMDTPLDSTNVE